MGLSIVISGAIIMVSLMYVLFSMPGLMNSIFSVEEKSSEISTLENSILQTSISIDSITAISGDTTITFDLNNQGSEKLWNYDEFELFVTYDADISGSSERVTEQIKYALPDFNVQRSCTTIPVGSISLTLSPGTDYIAPTGEAFVRIVDTRLSGNGDTINPGTNRNVDDITAYISDATDLSTQIVFTRTGSSEDTRICWELIDYVGPSDGNNAIKVHDRNTVTYATTVLTATGSVITPTPLPVDSDIVVFITGQAGDDTTFNDRNNAMSTAEWLGGTDQPRFTRGQADGSQDTSDLSYAIVEFTGSNWIIQRVEHDYGGTGLETATAPADFNAVDALNKAVLHTQHRSGNNLSGLDEQGEEAWLSAVGTISFDLENGATGPFPGSYFTVVWIIEYTGSQGSEMNVQHISGNRGSVDCAPACNGIEDIFIETLPTAVEDMKTTSIMGENARSTGGGTSYPRGALSLELISNTEVELRRSDHTVGGGCFGQCQTYRFSVVEWPSEDNVAAPQWEIVSLVPNILDPGILNEDESAKISVLLSNPIFTSGNVVIVISTDQGISTSGSVIAI